MPPTRVRGGERADTDQMLRCRTFGHQWDDFYPSDMQPPPFGWRLSLRCVRCTTERHDLVSHRSGEVLAREYRYVDGYQQRRDERLDRLALRLALYERVRSRLAPSALAEEATVTEITNKRKRAG